jgi:bacterioferritin-associated ferredoxin
VEPAVKRPEGRDLEALVYVCICARVRECDVRAAIRCGARTEDAVGDACGAGTGCGTCVGRIEELISEEHPTGTLVAAGR